MRIGIITFHASFNYGSMLQAWAMQSWLQKYGHEVKIINYRSVKQKQIYSHPFAINSLRSILALVYKTLRFGTAYWNKRYRWNKFNDFLNSELNISKEYNSVEELITTPLDIEVLICGSDQIWNPKAGDFSEAYFGNFVTSSIRKIAYAPSMGQNPEELDPSIFSNLIKGFDQIAVREKRSADFLRKYDLYPSAKVVCDPTLLLTKEDYTPLIDIRPLIEEKYLYYYAPFHHPSHLHIAKEEAQRMKLKLVVDTGYKSVRREKDIMYVENAGPREFLNLIKNAEYVSASSYHAIIFSILFGKNFTAIDGNTDSRKMSLLNKLNITNRSASTNPYLRPTYNSLDWSIIYSRLNSLRAQSSNFLTNAIINNPTIS